MRLEKFRVTNFRNVNDSGWIEVSGVTALVGRNESGKTNLLHALRSVSGPDASEAFQVSRDFPADRLRSQYTDELDVVCARFALDADERTALAEILPGGERVNAVEVERGYLPERRVRFCGLVEAEAPVERAKELVARLAEAASGSGDPAWREALDELRAAVGRHGEDLRDWAALVTTALHGLQGPIALRGPELAGGARATLEEIGDLAAQMANSSEYENAARQWILRRLPRFLYLDQYPDIDGHMNLSEFLLRRRDETPDPNDRYFEMLLRVAGLDPDGLEDLLQEAPEVRRQIVTRAGAGITRRLRDLWTDRRLKVRFHLDGEHFDTVIGDPTSACDVEVNLSQRSRGFRWFFSFYVLLAASEDEAGEEGSVLLLDEPGIHLHAVGQGDLLRHLCELEPQTVLATQSPYMIPQGEAGCVRAVCFDEESGARVRVEPEADGRTLAPVLHVAASQVATGLFGTEPTLVVEHLTDYWYLRAISDHLSDEKRAGLPEGFVITPAGGAVLVPQLLAILEQKPSRPLVVLSSTPLSAAARSVVFLGSVLEEPPAGRVEVEDLFDREVYERFVRVAYRDKLKEREIQPDPSIANAVERFDDAFARAGLSFARREPARLVVSGGGRNVRALLSRQTGERFERLFALVRRQVDLMRG
jgi:energy-coupling factor transporter ATP-binding protein EcfA2